MKKISGVIFIVTLAASLLVLDVYAQEAQSDAATCNRACLINLVDAYLSALVSHDPGRVQIADNARFVENATALVPGAGLWKDAAEVPTSFKIYVPDPVAQ